ncbi:hypothetical protein ALC57_00551, partial [Trachymyrmex cornetzi]
DTKNIFIYDSLNNETLHKQHELFLKKLFPIYDFEKNPVKFAKIQRQPNCNDCGVFAIAFATSLLFNLKPDRVTYNHKLTRLHLIKILQTNIIEHFPQNLQYAHPQKVLPIEVMRAREAEALRLQTIRRLTKSHDNCAVKMLQNITKEITLSQNSKNNPNIKRCLKQNLDEQNLENKRAKRRCQYRNYIKYYNPVAIENIFNKLDINNHIEKRLKAERIIRRCMQIRDSYIRDMYKIVVLLKRKSEVCLILATKCKTIDEKLIAFCGKSKHTALFENYFINGTYRNISSSQVLAMNMKGQVTNVLPLIEAQAKKVWLYDDNVCKIDPFLMLRPGGLHDFLVSRSLNRVNVETGREKKMRKLTVTGRRA